MSIRGSLKRARQQMQGECALIVDDEPVFRSLVRSWLEEFGLMVFEAEHP